MTRVLLLVLAAAGMAVSGCSQTCTPNAGVSIDQEPCMGEKISGMCVVSYYNADGSYYLTEQQHQFCSDPKQLKVWADEPTGVFKWRLTGDVFEVIAGANGAEDMERTLLDRNIARVLFTSMMAGSGIESGSTGMKFTTEKIDGKWYDATDLGVAGKGWGSETIYRSRKNSRIELVRLEDIDKGIVLTARCYNYRQSKDIAKTAPMKIDISSSDIAGGASKLMLKVEYISLH